MSRIGRKPITVPTGVEVTIEARSLSVKGPKGELSCPIMEGLVVTQADGVVTIAKRQETAATQRSFGLMRTLVANLVIGVSEGYQRQLEINGVGYRASVNGQELNLSLGFSHPIQMVLPEGVAAKVERNIITVSGYDKQLVGQVAANIRSLKKPEPYKGKGIKYIEEKIRRKAGKAATKG